MDATSRLQGRKEEEASWWKSFHESFLWETVVSVVQKFLFVFSIWLFCLSSTTGLVDEKAFVQELLMRDCYCCPVLVLMKVHCALALWTAVHHCALSFLWECTVQQTKERGDHLMKKSQRTFTRALISGIHQNSQQWRKYIKDISQCPGFPILIGYCWLSKGVQGRGYGRGGVLDFTEPLNHLKAVWLVV